MTVRLRAGHLGDSSHQFLQELRLETSRLQIAGLAGCLAALG